MHTLYIGQHDTLHNYLYLLYYYWYHHHLERLMIYYYYIYIPLLRKTSSQLFMRL